MCTFTTWGDVNSQSLQWGCKGRILKGLLFLTPFPTSVFFLRGALEASGRSRAGSARRRDTVLVPTQRRGKSRGKSGC